MRPKRYFATFEMGRVIGIHHGHDAARRSIGGSRAYLSFSSRKAAEEYFMWHNYERDRSSYQPKTEFGARLWATVTETVRA